MIKKFLDKLLGKGPDAAHATPRSRSKKPKFGKREDVPHSVHGIDPALVDDRALNVVSTLQQAGFEAYIVGGAVRDLLVGLRPKDFDVATNATPEQVKGLFRRAFIIGRRFRIVHVVYGRGREHEVIEVSTFRAYMDAAAAEQVAGNERTSKQELAGLKHAVDASGRVLRDNVWGPMEEDAARRDFSINAMYYDPRSQVVVDYHHGIADAKARTLRMIGDPATRYREDPVRIIRAVRFAAKLSPLGFKLDTGTAEPLVRSQQLLADVPQSRLFDEMLKLLQTGHALATIAQLKALGLARGIYPLLDVVVERAELPLVNAALQDTDRRVGEGKPVAPSFLLACVLWPDVHSSWERRMNGNHHGSGPRQPPFAALQDAIDDTFNNRIGDVSGRGKLAADMRDIWLMQPRFDKRVGSGPYSLVEQPRFRAGFDFMRLRAQTGEVDEALAEWWETFSTADDSVRQDLVDQARDEQQRRPRKAAPPRAVPRAADATPGDDTLSDGQEGNDGADATPAEGDAAPRKRRRRRRSSNSRRSGEAGASPASEGGPAAD